MSKQINGVDIAEFKKLVVIINNYCPSDFDMRDKFDGNDCDEGCLQCWSYAIANVVAPKDEKDA